MQAVALNQTTRRLSAAYLFSKIGEFAFEAAFAVTVVRLANANLFIIGVIYFLRYIPTLIFSPLGGWVADNLSKKHVLIAAELLKGVAASSLFFIIEFREDAVSLVVLASMAMTAGDCLYTPAFRAYSAGLVENEKLPSLNSGIQAIEDCSSIVGPLLFALISISISPAATFLLVASCLTISIAWTLALYNPVTTRERSKLPKISIFKDAFFSVNLMRRSNAPLFAIICCTTVCAMFATSVLRFILPAAVLTEFQDEAAVGYIYALLASGTILGSFLFEFFNSGAPALAVVRYWCIYGTLLLFSALALELNTTLFIVTLFFVGFAGAFVDISIVTSIQLLSRQEEVGKNYSLYYLTAVIGDALSGLIASLVFLIAGPATFMGMTFLLSIAPLGWSNQRDENNEHDHA